MILKLKRFYNNINYTLGILTVEDINNINVDLFFILELPYRNNERFISCIAREIVIDLKIVLK